MSQTTSALFVLSFISCLSEDCHFDPESTEMLNAIIVHHKDVEVYQREQGPLNQACNPASLLSLPLDLRMKLTEHLQREDIRSLARSCKLNLASCRQFAHRLLSIKFDYLLNHNESRITINHLLNIPFVDSITPHPLLMASYFGAMRRPQTS